MSRWRPDLPTFLAAMRTPARWGVELRDFAVGIDNAHVDVALSSSFHAVGIETVRNLVAEHVCGYLHGPPRQLVGAADLEQFRLAYLGLFETAIARAGRAATVELPVLLQLSILKWLLQSVTLENRNLRDSYKRAARNPELVDSGRSLEVHEQLVVLMRQGPAIERRVLQLLLHQITKVESGALEQLRAVMLTTAWPFPTSAQFNPVLLAPSLDQPDALAADYQVAHLAENGATEWLTQTGTALVGAFAPWLPDFCQRAPHPKRAHGERRDQGLLPGFLAAELLLSTFVAGEEYRAGKVSWLDEPDNLRQLLALPEADGRQAPSRLPTSFSSPEWLAFRAEVRTLLHRRLDHWGLTERIILAYWLPALRRQLGSGLSLSLLGDYCIGLMPKRRLGQRLASVQPELDPAEAARALDRTAAALRRFTPAERGVYLDRYLVDFLVLRRDLKLAYKTFEAIDRIRLLNDPAELGLSRANGTLYEFPAPTDPPPEAPRIRAHVVIKADVRGSTGMTDKLRARGLNPASHFSLNLFTPVNDLLPAFGAEKLFVEGDAVILALYDEGQDEPKPIVARACGLARSILDVVALQNVTNRKHGLPELELGLGIAFLPREPHFLYDDGRRIMISPAINAAHRLSACSSRLRAAAWTPPEPAWRVFSVRRPPPADGSEPATLLTWNVNGIQLGATAFYQLKREISLRRARLNDTEDADLYFLGRYRDRTGHNRTLAVRCARVHDWVGQRPGQRDPNGRHYFEVITDEDIITALRRRAGQDSEGAGASDPVND